jgi:hypothetical protein
MALVIPTSVRLWDIMRRCLWRASWLRHAVLLRLRRTHLLLLRCPHWLRLWRAHLLLLWCTHLLLRLRLWRTHRLRLWRTLHLLRVGEVFLVVRRAWNLSALDSLALLRVKRPAGVVLHASLLLLQ